MNTLSPGVVLASTGHDADTVVAEGLAGAPDEDVVAAAAAASRAVPPFCAAGAHLAIVGGALR